MKPSSTLTAPSAEQLKYERAARAVRNFNRIKPQLEAFARVFTGNKDMFILPTHGASATDGDKIFMRVNVELGDEYRHDTYKCDKRDALDQLLCSACMARENMMVPLFHEIGHIVYDSFQAMSEGDKRHAITEAVAEAERYGVSGRRLEAIRQAMTERPPSTYVEAASRISPFLHPILNALEDARVNALTMKARPGMKVMFSARSVRIFEHGAEQIDGSVVFWREQPENAQIIIGLFALASDYPYEGWFVPAVEEALDDPELRNLVYAAMDAEEAQETYALGFPILERLRKLGYCKVPDEPQDEEDEPDPLANEDGDPTEDQEDTGGDHDDEGEPDEAESDDEQGDGAKNSGDGEQEEAQDESDGEAGISAEQEGQQKSSSGDAADDGDDEDADDEEDGSPVGSQNEDADDEESDSDLGSGDSSGPGEQEDDEEGDEGEGDAGEDDGDDAGSGEDSDDNESEAPESDGESGEGESSESDDPHTEEDGESDDGSDSDPLGSPDEVAAALSVFGEHDDGHDHGDESDDDEESEHGGEADDEDAVALQRAIAQERDFDSQAEAVLEVVVHEDGQGPSVNHRVVRARPEYAVDPISETMIQRSLGKMRVAFSENKKGSRERNLKSGRINAGALARRVPFDDPRAFQKRRRPGKRDYHVIIGVDVSGSTNYHGRLKVIKSAAMAQAELLHRVGVTFEVWAHSCDFSGVHNPAYDLGKAQYDEYFNVQMNCIKSAQGPWDSNARSKLEGLIPHQANLDGHTLEFYRKRLDKSNATDKLIMYYTDGDMPYANFHEELTVLQREIQTCKQRKYEIVGVGIGNDDPKNHGLDTVRIDSVDDVHFVVEELHKRLTR